MLDKAMGAILRETDEAARDAQPLQQANHENKQHDTRHETQHHTTNIPFSVFNHATPHCAVIQCVVLLCL